MTSNLPKPPKIEDEGLEKWLTDREVDYNTFMVLVGPDPDNPRVSKRRLAKELKQGHVFAESTITRWLAQMKSEMQK